MVTTIVTRESSGTQVITSWLLEALYHLTLIISVVSVGPPQLGFFILFLAL